ncbi:MAG: hypothetical protein A3H49_05305 [Nitrospirae bacterium RIFCSPLOWO2_02_FULL_62_14]|nr:MAG: hypothetical protein A3H49_05305 [Nitrospirae bacterium RIFCSPLOWO2_02_FULL_62_14]OGW69986.1 MAG: hypothetical protein A3A88_07720 [Nitrospirae bacterium RIFCSPLOWO2_01_FULL_62_17]
MVKKALLHPARPTRAKTRVFPVATVAAARERGGTYQASLEPLASIKCERIVTLPPVGLDPYVELPSDARTKLADFFSILLQWAAVGREQPS